MKTYDKEKEKLEKRLRQLENRKEPEAEENVFKEEQKENTLKKEIKKLIVKPVVQRINKQTAKPIAKVQRTPKLIIQDKENRDLDEREIEKEEKVFRGKPRPEDVAECRENIRKLKQEIAKVIVGQEDIIDGLITGLICNSHVLVEGVPGIAKTLAIKALASASGCLVKRVQFTVDLLPTDIIGLTSYTPEKGFEIIKGPIFSNFLIADEINRAPPKTQSALIEGMQEKQVTIGREKFMLPVPFFVMATENPIENAGVYPLPEAQIDRFLFKLVMKYPEKEEERKIMQYNTTIDSFESFNLQSVISPKDIIKMQEVVKKIYLDDNIKTYILDIVRKSREKDFEMSKYISYGCSPRACIGLFIASKARALIEGRDFVLPEDVKKVAFDVLRHRLILSYKANVEKINSDSIIHEILNLVKVD